jgi:hypothetical protein
MFVIKVFRGDEEPQIPPPFESRQTAGEWNLASTSPGLNHTAGVVVAGTEGKGGVRA